MGHHRISELLTKSKNAELSACGQFRYVLSRSFDGPFSAGPHLVWVMLNPSTADTNVDDPTIRKCIGFSKRRGYHGIIVVNLYAWKATKPADLRAANKERVTIGVDCDRWIGDAFRYAQSRSGEVMFAWGQPGPVVSRPDQVGRMAIETGCQPKCIGRNRNGEPRHPLMPAYSSEILEYLPAKWSGILGNEQRSG